MTKRLHGNWNRPLYHIWNNMIRRCYNPLNKSFNYYGERGIEVCDRWKYNLLNFIEDMYPTYKKGMTLDRVNNNGNYEPDNCIWSTMKEQCKNRRNNLKIEYNGDIYIAKDLCENLGIKYKTFWMGINTYKFSIEKAISLGLKNKNK